MIHWYIVFNVNEKYTPDRDWIYILYSSFFSNFTDMLKHLSASSLLPNFCNESPLFLYALVLYGYNFIASSYFLIDSS